MIGDINSPKADGVKIGRIVQRLLCHIGLIFLCIIVLIPFFWMVSCSLKTLPAIFKYPPEWIPSPRRWSNYRFVLTVTETFPFYRYFLNTLFVSVARTLGTLMIPPQVTMIPTFVIMKYLKWIDTYYALIFLGYPSMFSAFGIFLLRQFFLTLPREIEDAAAVDGCGHFRRYWQILLPLSKPALAALGIFTFINTWNEFLWPLIVIESDFMKTLTLGLASFQGQYYIEWHYLMVGAVITTIPPISLYIAAQRSFIQGITLTGIKR